MLSHVCHHNNRILMSIWAAGWNHFIPHPAAGLGALHIELGTRKWPHSAGFSFDARSIINPNIISWAPFPRTHHRKECVWLKITRTENSASHSIPNGTGEKRRHAFKEPKPVISISYQLHLCWSTPANAAFTAHNALVMLRGPSPLRDAEERTILSVSRAAQEQWERDTNQQQTEGNGGRREQGPEKGGRKGNDRKKAVV